jgi:hypothetical protein
MDVGSLFPSFLNSQGNAKGTEAIFEQRIISTIAIDGVSVCCNL